jgi:4-alpha-glucanotransferase
MRGVQEGTPSRLAWSGGAGTMDTTRVNRVSGVLAHPTSFPGPHGIGDLGETAYRFVDWLVVAGQRLWQLMPLGPTGYGDSPYAALSAFAGNPLLISLDRLVGEGLLEADDLQGLPELHQWEVEYGPVIDLKVPLLRRAFDRFRAGAAADHRPAFEAFRDQHAGWLDDFGLFLALKSEHEAQPWTTWEAPIRLRETGAIAEARQRLAGEIQYHQFVQFQFYRQWADLRRYANERDVRIVGDVPIFVAHDSADVWANRHLFKLDEEGDPRVVAGVPPDYFSATGQLWGNPVYDWDAAAAAGYAWWIARMRAVLTQVDVVRIDHFRGFAAAWVVPAGDDTAAGGRWERGPERAFFDALRDAVGDVTIIVEDLGLITSDVIALRDELGLPGMNVLQFAFGDDPDNAYLPHNHVRNSVVYSATHDNQTTVGWFQGLVERDRQAVQRYIGTDGSDIAWDMIRLALSSVADTAILALQDVMRLGDEARMNTPGRPWGNWSWRYLPHQLHDGLAAGLGELTTAYGRRRRDPIAKGRDPFDYTAPGTSHPLR